MARIVLVQRGYARDWSPVGLAAVVRAVRGDPPRAGGRGGGAGPARRQHPGNRTRARARTNVLQLNVARVAAVLPGYASVARAAEALHLAPRSVRDLIYAGRLPSLRIGRLHYVRASDLELERRRRLGLPLPQPQMSRRQPRPARARQPRAVVAPEAEPTTAAQDGTGAPAPERPH